MTERTDSDLVQTGWDPYPGGVLTVLSLFAQT
jgi:hypothetical protein